MIVFLVLLILAIAVGALLATLIVRDAGYVLVSYDGATLETSLWFALAAALALGLVVYAVVLVTRRVLGGGSAVSGWVRSRRTTTARNRTVRGLMLLAEERWQEAGDAFQAAAKRVDTPLFNHLAAARAASELGRFEERDTILRRHARPPPRPRSPSTWFAPNCSSRPDNGVPASTPSGRCAARRPVIRW